MKRKRELRGWSTLPRLATALFASPHWAWSNAVQGPNSNARKNPSTCHGQSMDNQGQSTHVGAIPSKYIDLWLGMAIMRGWCHHSNPRQALFLVLLMLLLPMASQVQAIQTLPEVQEPTHAPPILVEGLPPLMCGEELCDQYI